MSGVSLILALFIKSRGRINANCFMTAWRPEYTPRGPQVRELQVITREQNYGANGSAHRRSHRRGPPYRDSAIAAPTHNYFSLNSPVSVHSPSPPGSPGRQWPSSSLVRQLHKEQILCRVAMGASAEFAPRNGSLSTN